MTMRIATLAVTALLVHSTAGADATLEYTQRDTDLSRTAIARATTYTGPSAGAPQSRAITRGGADRNRQAMSASDRKVSRYVELAHQQLDSWAEQLMTRLQRGLTPRQSDPMLDGRAFFQVKKLRLNYAEQAQSPALRAAIHRLADLHEQRLRTIESMMVYGVDYPRFAAVSEPLAPVVDAIASAAPRLAADDSPQ